MFDELLGAELIDQVRFTPSAEYAFRHPLIRAVAYESQLKSDRAEWHRRLAAAIQERVPGSVEENAALIAEHLEAAGDLHAAYGWHMRAAAWSTNRDLVAARLSWERARHDRRRAARRRPRPAVDAHRPSHHAVCHRLAGPAVQESRGRFAELRELCGAAGDKASLAIAMTGPATELLYAGRRARGGAAGIRTDGAARVDRRSHPDRGAGVRRVLQLVQPVNSARSAVVADARPGGRRPRQGRRLRCRITAGGRAGIARRRTVVAPSRMAPRPPRRRRDGPTQRPGNFAAVVAWTYGRRSYGVLGADDSALRAIEEAVQTAQREGATISHCRLFAEYALGAALLVGTPRLTVTAGWS